MKWHYLVYQDTDRKRLPMNLRQDKAIGNTASSFSAN